MSAPGLEPISPRLGRRRSRVFASPRDCVGAWRQKRRSSPAWTAVVALIVAVVALPVATVAAAGARRLPTTSGRTSSRPCCRARCARTLLLAAGVGGADVRGRHGGGVARHHVPLSRAARCSTGCWCCRSRCRPTSSPTATSSCSTMPAPCRRRCGRASASRAPATTGFRRCARSAAPCSCSRRCSTRMSISRRARASPSSRCACSRWRARSAARRSRTFADVALPLARPAIAAGVALVVMECLNDLGAVQYLGVETLSASIYRHLDAALEPRRRGAARRRHAGAHRRACSPSSARRAAARAATTRPAATAPSRSRTSTAGRARWPPALAALPFVFGFVVPVLVIAAGRGDAHRGRAVERLPGGRRQQPAAGRHRRRRSPSPSR